jgi:hypothetical protein
MDLDEQVEILSRLPISNAQLHELLLTLGCKPVEEEEKKEDAAQLGSASGTVLAQAGNSG